MASIDMEGGSDLDPPIVVPLSVLATTGSTTIEAVPAADGTFMDVVGPDLRAHIMILHELGN